MTRRTSVEAYHRIDAEGLLSKRRFEVYSILFKIGPATAAEISDKSFRFKNPSKGDNSHARLIELRELGCVVEVGERKCSITGMNVILWDVTEKLPLRIVANKRRDILTRIEKYKRLIQTLEQSLERMDRPK